MNYRQLGDSDIKVSVICLGTMTFGNPVKKKEAIELVNWSFDSGLNFFDTADIYEGYDRHPQSFGGIAEKILGKALKGKRDKVIITTKVGNSIGGKYSGSGLNKKHINHQINRSLKYLKTDYVDIYQMHKPDPKIPIEESISSFLELIELGKIRYWGISNFGVNQLEDILKICEINDWQKPLVCQSPYSWLNRQLENDLIPLLESNNISLTPYRILEGGLLTGKYKKGKELKEENRLNSKSVWVGKFSHNSNNSIENFELEANKMNLKPVQYASKWLLNKPLIPSVIVGARNKMQIVPFLSMKVV